jgi:hypothetical protein
MLRVLGCTVVGLSLAIFAASDAISAPQKNQMVKGTIKSVDTSKDLLIVNQKVKNETVDRELSILESTEFLVIDGADKKEAVGRAGLRLLEGKENSPVQVKCDKDVNVIKVTVTIKK